MNTKTMLVTTGALLMLVGIVLLNRAMGHAWAVGLAVSGIVVVILVSGVAAGVADSNAFIVAVALAVVVCIGVALHGGVAAIILEALGGSVTLAVASAAILAGVGGALFGIGIVQRRHPEKGTKPHLIFHHK